MHSQPKAPGRTPSELAIKRPAGTDLGATASGRSIIAIIARPAHVSNGRDSSNMTKPGLTRVCRVDDMHGSDNMLRSLTHARRTAPVVLERLLAILNIGGCSMELLQEDLVTGVTSQPDSHLGLFV